MNQLEGFIVESLNNQVRRFKQAPKQWYKKFEIVLTSSCYVINAISTFENNRFVIICLYVDNMLIIGTNLNVINKTKLLFFKNN